MINAIQNEYQSFEDLKNASDRKARQRLTKKALLAWMLKMLFPYGQTDWASRIEMRESEYFAALQNTVFIGPNLKEYRLDSVTAFSDADDDEWLLHVELQNCPLDKKRFFVREFSYAGIQLLFQRMIGDQDRLMHLCGLLSVWIVFDGSAKVSKVVSLDDRNALPEYEEGIKRPVLRYAIIIGKDAKHSENDLVRLLYYYFVERDPASIQTGLASFGIHESEKEVQEMCTLTDYFLEQGRVEGLEQGREEGITEGTINTAVNAIKDVVASTGINPNQAYQAVTTSLSEYEKAAVRKQLGL